MQTVFNCPVEPGTPTEKQFTISVGRLGLTLDLSAQEGWLDLSDSLPVQPFASFVEPANDYNLKLKIESLAVQSLTGPPANGLNWHYQSKDEQSSLYWCPPLSDKGWTHYLELDLTNRQGRLQLTRSEAWPRLAYREIFPGLLDKFIFTMLLNRLGGCLIHSASLADGPKGLLLVGDSGTGKSTSSRLWQSYGDPQIRCLSDESSMVRELNDQFWIFGTPWPSAAGIANPAGVVLDRIYFLRHAPFNETQPLDSRAILFRLLQQGRFSFWDGQGVGVAIDILVKLAKSIPACELGFVPDHSVITFVRSLGQTLD